MYFTIWIANQTIPWVTKLAETTNSMNGASQLAALDQGGSPITYVFTEIFTRDNVPGMLIVGGIYAVCLIFAVRTSKQRAKALKEENIA